MSDKITYPITVDEKTLWAMILCGDAIIRNPTPDRVGHWSKLRDQIAEQCKLSRSEPTRPTATPASSNASETPCWPRLRR